MAIYAGGFKGAQLPWQISSGGYIQRGNKEAPKRISLRKFLQEDRQLRSTVRTTRNRIPKWTKLASSLIFSKMTKRLFVVLDRSFFDRFSKPERGLTSRISYRAVGSEPLFKHAH